MRIDNLLFMNVRFYPGAAKPRRDVAASARGHADHNATRRR
jgi:hypothetical protein